MGVESSAGVDAARALVRQSLTGGSQRPGGPFGVPALAKERGDCAMEVAVNLQPILDAARAEGFNSPMEERMFDMMFSQVTWAYGSMSLGTGETSDLEFVVPYGAESALAGLFANFNAADLSSFSSIPAEAHTAQVINIDLAGIFDWAMDLVKAEDEMTYEQVMAGIESSATFLVISRPQATLDTAAETTHGARGDDPFGGTADSGKQIDAGPASGRHDGTGNVTIDDEFDTGPGFADRVDQ